MLTDDTQAEWTILTLGISVAHTSGISLDDITRHTVKHNGL